MCIRDRVVADGGFYGISISGLSGGLLGQIGTYAPEDLLKLKNSQQVFTFSTSTACLLYTSPSPRDRTRSRMPSSA